MVGLLRDAMLVVVVVLLLLLHRQAWQETR